MSHLQAVRPHDTKSRTGRRYVGPKKFGYPPLRRSRTGELAAELSDLRRYVEKLEARVQRMHVDLLYLVLCHECRNGLHDD